MEIHTIIDFLSNLKYDDYEGSRKLNDYQKNYNEKMDSAIRMLSLLNAMNGRKKLIEDYDCPNRVCPTR